MSHNLVKYVFVLAGTVTIYKFCRPNFIVRPCAWRSFTHKGNALQAAPGAEKPSGNFNSPMKMGGRLVEEGVVLSDELSSDALGRWGSLHDHSYGLAARVACD